MNVQRRQSKSVSIGAIVCGSSASEFYGYFKLLLLGVQRLEFFEKGMKF